MNCVSWGGVNKSSPVEYTIDISSPETLNQKTSKMSSFILAVLLLGLTASNITCTLPKTHDLNESLIYNINNYSGGYNSRPRQ